MRTFFIYDTAYCKADEDDPKDAILYFFPYQIHENQCYSLCCQIVGVAKFLKSTFSCPSLISLDKEKFAVHWSGRYLFVLGGNADCHGNVLKQQLLFLCGIFCFYHGSINNVLRICKNDRKEFISRMELAWSRYTTFLQCFNNLLNVPVNAVPLPFVKKYAEAVSKANELLRMCQLSASVIAGAVYCNGRVLLSQLNPELTSYLTLMSNENAASPVSNVNSPVENLPPNVELKCVYLSRRVIQSIVRHNHAHFGSSVRVKMNKKTQTLHLSSYCENVTSGSEGDVDSGHCTERVYQRRKNTLDTLKTQNRKHNFEFNFKSQILCCSMHAEIFKMDILKCRNRIFIKYMNSEFLSEKVKFFEKKTNAHINTNVKRKMSVQKAKKGANADNQVLSFNLLCHHHADIFSENFLLKQTYNHLNLSSTCDLEYSCYFCINHQFSKNVTPFSSKNWNSEMQIPDYFHDIPLKHQTGEYASDKHKKGKTSKCKIQILKCRARTGTCIHCAKMSNSKHHTSYSSLNSCISDDYCENIENNDLEKCTLYVQRCENNMLLLLMNKSYDGNILTYLWNCGFTFLKDLEYHVERKTEENSEADAINYILICNNAQKVLKERPQCQASVFTEKITKDSVQAIQEDFLSNPKLQMFSLLSTNQNIFAYQAKEQSAFYLQQDSNSRKSESLCNLNKKAGRRLEKYLNFST